MAQDLDRHLAAIWFADVVGYTRISEENERAAWRLVSTFQSVAREVVRLFGGRLVKFIGDGALAEFPSTELAVRSGHALMRRFAMAAREAGLGERDLRVGVHVGDVGTTPDGDLIGDGVNVAARIQSVANSGEVWVSNDVRRQMRQHPEFRFEDRGEHKVKGIAQPLPLHAVIVTDEDEWVRPLQRNGANRRRILAGTAIILFLLAGTWLILSLDPAPLEVTPSDPGRVAVIPFENRTGDRTLDPIGQIAADWIGEFIVRTGFVEVVDMTSILAMQSSTDQDDILQANKIGAGTLITGSYYKQGDTLSFQTRILRSDGTVITALPAITGDSKDPIEVIDRLRERVVTALAVHFDKRLKGFEGVGGQPPSFAAYEKYVDGLRLYLLGNYDSAAKELQQAIEIDSTFARARIWLLAARGFSDPESVDSLSAAIERHESDLSIYDRHHARFFTAFVTGNLEQAYAQAAAMHEASPGSRDAIREMALSAIRLGQSAEGIRLLRQLSSEPVLVDTWPEYWSYLSMAYLQAGDPAKALEVARQGRSRHEDQPPAIVAEALALVDLGRVGEAMDTLEPLFHVGHSRSYVGSGLLAVALRASVRGDRAAGDSLLEETIAWMESLSRNLQDQGKPEYSGFKDAYIRALIAAERPHQVISLIEQDLANGLRSAEVLGPYGIVLARTGNLEEARSVLAELAGPDGQEYPIWRARILAAMGNSQEAIRALGRIHIDPWGVETPVALWPEFTAIRDDPDFPMLPVLRKGSSGGRGG